MLGSTSKSKSLEVNISWMVWFSRLIFKYTEKESSVNLSNATIANSKSRLFLQFCSTKITAIWHATLQLLSSCFRNVVNILQTDGFVVWHCCHGAFWHDSAAVVPSLKIPCWEQAHRREIDWSHLSLLCFVRQHSELFSSRSFYWTPHVSFSMSCGVSYKIS